MPYFRLRFSIAALALAACLGPGASAQQTGTENIIDAEEPEPVSRYAIEVILFTYGASVTAGTEVFPPEPLPPVDGQQRDGAGYPISEFPPSDGMAPFSADEALGADGADAGDLPAGEADPAVPSFGDTIPPEAALADIDLDEPLEPIVTDASSIEFTRLVGEDLSLAAAPAIAQHRSDP